MKQLYVLPLVGSILLLVGLCFPVFYLYDGITIWLWGFYTVKQNSTGYFQITNAIEFETFLRSTFILGFC
ncbi:MAG: hypothetical protein ACFFCC_19435, partial [Promethearchaeota archaeon]